MSKLLFLAAATLLLLIVVTSFSSNTSKDRSQVASSCQPISFSEVYDLNEKTAIFEGKKIDIPELALGGPKENVLGTTNDERWIEVDLSEQKLKAWEGSSLFLETLVSTGLPWYPTPQGEFRVGYKVRATKMEGGSGRYYYYLPNVPYVMFFGNETVPWSRGYGLHGTYWHNDFGTQRSHGCVNLPTPIAERLYYWTSPQVPEGKGYIRSDDSSGTRISIHQ